MLSGSKSVMSLNFDYKNIFLVKLKKKKKIGILDSQKKHIDRSVSLIIFWNRFFVERILANEMKRNDI